MKCRECDKQLGYIRNNGTEWFCRSCGAVTKLKEDKDDDKEE